MQHFFLLKAIFIETCFSRFQIQDFPGMLNFYHISVIQFFKSNWPEVRAGAAMFIGMTQTLTWENQGIYSDKLSPLLLCFAVPKNNTQGTNEWTHHLMCICFCYFCIIRVSAGESSRGAFLPPQHGEHH